MACAACSLQVFLGSITGSYLTESYLQSADSRWPGALPTGESTSTGRLVNRGQQLADFRFFFLIWTPLQCRSERRAGSGLIA